MKPHFISIIIVDDEPGAAADLEQLLKPHSGVKVLRTIRDASMAVDTILEEQPDLIFLDIQMPLMSGFDIAEALAKEDFFPPIIFVTAYDHFAIEAIRHSAFDFLVKPVMPDELNRALNRLHENPAEHPVRENYIRLIERSKAIKRLKINTTGGFTLIDPDEIIYIRADWNYSEIFLGQSRREVCTLNIGTVAEMLPQDRFFRISRSLIINTRYLTKVSRKKREAMLVKADEEFTMAIPLLNIRKLEQFME